MPELTSSQHFRLEAANILTRMGGSFDVWDVLSLAHTLQTGKVKSREDLVEENKESNK